MIWRLFKALLDFDLKKHRMSMNVNIVIDDPEELERVRQKEMDITKARFGGNSGYCDGGNTQRISRRSGLPTNKAVNST